MTGLAIAGVGWLGESLIKDVPRVPPLQVVAIQDVNAERAAAVATQYAIPRTLGRYEDLLSATDVEAVVICTPNALHASQAQAALRAGKHVLVQKPLALSCASAAETVSVAEQTGRLLFVDYTYRFLDTVVALRSAIDRPVRSLRAAFHNIYGPGIEKPWFFDRSMSGGGALVDLGVHLLDLALWLLAPREVQLLDRSLQRTETVEAAASLRLSCDRVPVEIEVSWNAPRPETEIAVDVQLVNGKRVRWENVQGSFFHFRTLVDNTIIADRETTLREDTLRAFKRALDGSSTPLVDVRVYDLLDAAYR